jgi:hypothetical protein
VLLRLPAALETQKTRAIGYKLRDAANRSVETALAGKPVTAEKVAAVEAAGGGRQVVVDLAGPVHVSSREVGGGWRLCMHVLCCWCCCDMPPGGRLVVADG